jgi:hypothetical protein
VGLRPRLNVRCGRCGRPREGLRHVCRSNSRRRATIRLAPALGTCPRCGKDYGNPLTHVCRPKSDFRSRKAAVGRQAQASARKAVRDAERGRQRARIARVRERERERSKARAARLKASYEARLAAAKAKARTQAKSPAPKATRPRRPPHEYQSCADDKCLRPVCVAFKEGYRDGHRDGYQQGFERGDQAGYARGFPDGIEACPRSHSG